MHDLKGMEAQPPQRAWYFHSSLRGGYRPHPGIGQKWAEKGALIGLTKADWGQTWPSLAFKLGRSWSQVGPSLAEVGALLAEVEQWGPMLRHVAAMLDRTGEFGRRCADMQSVQITRAGNLFLGAGAPGEHAPPHS